MSSMFALLALPSVLGAVQPMKVFGHKIPDTDAICAAIAYSWELECRGMEAQPFRLGELNPETEYVLRALNIDTPPLLESVSPDDTVAIVDTNNPAELPDDVEKVCLLPPLSA